MLLRTHSANQELRRLRVIPPDSQIIIALISLALLLEAAFHILLPLTLGWVVDKGLSAPVLWTAVELLTATLIAALLTGAGRDYLNARLQSSAVRGMRQSMFERLQQLSMEFHYRANAEAILERFTSDSASVENALAMTPSWGVLPLLESIVATAVAFALDWRAGLAFLVMWPWVVLAPRLPAIKARKARRDLSDEESRVLGTVNETLRAQPVIRAFSLEQAGIAAFSKRNAALSARVMRTGLISALSDRFTESGILLLHVAAFSLNAWLVSNGQLTTGRMVSLQILLYLLGNALLYATEYLPSLENAKLAWDRITEGLDEPDPVCDQADAKILPALRSEISFDNVAFSYRGEDPTLRGVSLQVKRGTYVALVGPSGSGKSTLLKLLMRFHDPSSGAVFIDGHDLRAVTQQSLRTHLGVVLQENFVFNASIRDNLRIGKTGASEEKVTDAAKAAGLHEYIQQLPNRYDTVVGEGGYRLGGEAIQRLAIARAVLREADILLLDEIASALEPAEEARINETLVRVARNRTVISVSHRLSSTAGADRIFFLENGRVVEEGGHFELMAANGRYATLWRKQAGFRFSADGRHVDVDVQRLQQLPMLERLDEKVLAEIAPFFATETFPAGREIVRQNDPGDKFYIIVRGKVDVWRTDESNGVRTRMAVLHDGDFFGEITLITGFPRTATVRTQTVCTCISLGRGQFSRLFERNPELLREISQLALRRLRETTSNTMAEAAVPII